MVRIPYTYLIGWSRYNKWYYGSQYGSKANPGNLWVTYFTSSKEVRRLRKEYGEPDIIMVRKTFSSVKLCRLWEAKVLRRMKVTKIDKWVNMSDGDKNFYVVPGTTKRSDKTKAKQAAKTKEYWESEEGQEKKKRLAERNRRIKSQEMKDRWKTDKDFREKATEPHRRKKSDHTKRLMSEARKRWWRNNGNSVSNRQSCRCEE